MENIGKPVATTVRKCVDNFFTFAVCGETIDEAKYSFNAFSIGG